MRLTDRDADIIADVATYSVMTRTQIQRRHAIGSVPRANAVLLRLARAGYLARRYQPTVVGTRRPVYLLGRHGAELLNGKAEPARPREQVAALSDLFVHHQLAVNDVRIAFSQNDAAYAFDRWSTDGELRRANLGLVPDGYLEFLFHGQRFTAFVEVDRGTETLSRWTGKVTAYLQLAHSGLYTTTFSRSFFRTLVVAPTDRRLRHLRRTIASMTNEIFWLTTQPELVDAGPLAAIWRRPHDDQFHALTEP